AFALAETHKWPIGLDRHPLEAKAFYAAIASATLVGALINYSSINPIKALYWSAVINGVVAVPVMAIMMLMTANSNVMGKFTIKGHLRIIGWVATAVMAAAVVGMAITAAHLGGRRPARQARRPTPEVNLGHTLLGHNAPSSATHSTRCARARSPTSSSATSAPILAAMRSGMTPQEAQAAILVHSRRSGP